ncbi:MAG TPA: hypothetical protein VFV92_00425, partial [Candidatus Bathyarchaeia archaeon]|nr:hypothetical protein [Candidatus Bathyarchaeia archaeon]
RRRNVGWNCPSRTKGTQLNLPHDFSLRLLSPQHCLPLFVTHAYLLIDVKRGHLGLKIVPERNADVVPVAPRAQVLMVTVWIRSVVREDFTMFNCAFSRYGLNRVDESLDSGLSVVTRRTPVTLDINEHIFVELNIAGMFFGIKNFKVS